ncbi:MAG: hypothetical protein M3021_12700 [Actinomycetota bacterium]|nr:hypothetical protein [Actinomycetota bacterium]
MKPSWEALMLADLNGTGHYFHWSIVTISVANLTVVALMLLILLLALVVPFTPRKIMLALPHFW